MKPLIIINFKTYPESSGKKALLLARRIASVKSKKYDLALAPPLLELEHMCNTVNLKVFAQHVDAQTPGAHTGQITAQDVRKLGARGAILNHSERKLPFLMVERTVKERRKDKLITVVCAASLKEAKKVARLQPDYIAYEPPELIGGETSVTSAEPDIIAKTVRSVRRRSPHTKLLVGAGVQTREDVITALKLGASGVLLAHAVVKAKDPKKFLREMLK